jgi:hypothetical protein
MARGRLFAREVVAEAMRAYAEEMNGWTAAACRRQCVACRKCEGGEANPGNC